MNYIYCECFSPIFMAEYQRNNGENITIITNNVSVHNYCRARAITCVFIEKIVPTVLTFYKLLSFKKDIKKVIEEFKIEKNDKFFICDNSFILQGFYFCKLLNKFHIVYYYKTIEVNLKYRKLFPLKKHLLAHADALFYRIFLGLDTIILCDNNQPIIGIDQKFLKKNRISISHGNVDFNNLKIEILKSENWKLPKYETMFVDIGSASGILKANYLKNILHALNYKKDYIVIKEHPSFENENLFEDFIKYPKYIPAELLFENITKNIISIFSTTLLSASKINRLNAISLLELVYWEDNSYKLFTKEKLIRESNGKIIFVQTLEELETYI